ncbi:MAG TPA: metallopeptidase TldD-related protein [Candidatus Binataceae bacterium]|nr:metallopeptidase TldD-related protein [Candidatus Binataceae bacterium]
MPTLHALRDFLTRGLARAAREPGLRQFEIYAQSGEQIVARLNYTSDLPSRGVEETKSLHSQGLAVRVLTDDDPARFGSASRAGELNLPSLCAALAQARREAVHDPHFQSLPASRAPAAATWERPGLMGLTSLALTGYAWRILRGALDTFDHREEVPNPPALIVGGDLTLTRDRIAVAGSQLSGIRADESAHFTATVTVVIEATGAKSAASAAGRSIDQLEQAVQLGAQAMAGALRGGNGICPPEGRYPVLLGPQPIAEILGYMVLPSLSAASFYRADSAYYGRLASAVMDPRLDLEDNPRAAWGALHRQISCEGLSTTRTSLIRNGKVAGLMASYYDTLRLRAAQAGVAAQTSGLALKPNCGWRLGSYGGRRFDAPPRAVASNVALRARGGREEGKLAGDIRHGIQVGRVWYTYPINGQRAGDFTCTVSGDSYLIVDGRVSAPIVPNRLRINANIDEVFNAVRAAGNRTHLALVWGEPHVFYVPALAVDSLSFAPVGREPPR